MEVKIENIKQEPEVNFTLVLPTFQPDKKLIGDVKLEEFHPEEEANSKVKHIRRSRKSSKEFTCDICGKNFEIKRILLQHLRHHIKPFKCECGKSFGSKENLKQHRQTHDENRKKFECNLCPSSFTMKRDLNYHLKKHHFTFGEKFKCDKCNYEGKTKQCMRDHQYTHGKPFKCEKCEKRFSCNRYLKIHLKKHDGPDEFVCECSRVFSSSRDLNYHKLRMHKPGEPIEIDKGRNDCKVCHKSFSSRGNLIIHMKTHEEKQKCPICFELFTVRYLKQHIQRHELKKSEKYSSVINVQNLFSHQMS